MNRGDVYWVNLEPSIGSEANKRRPCVIVSRDASNRAAATVTVLAITSNVQRVYPFDVYLEGVLDRPSKVQANQVRTISKERLLGTAVTHIPVDLMKQVDAALRLHLAL
jgi:mRNA interferase MazF